MSDVHLRYIQLGSVTTASGGGGGGVVFAGMSDWHLGRHSSDSFGIARHTSLGGARQARHAQHPRHPARRTNQLGLLSTSSSCSCWGTSLLNSSHLTAVLRWQGGWNYHCLQFFVSSFWSPVKEGEGGCLNNKKTRIIFAIFTAAVVPPVLNPLRC